MAAMMLSMTAIAPNIETASDHFTPNPSAVPLSFKIESTKKMTKIASRKRTTMIFQIIS